MACTIDINIINNNPIDDDETEIDREIEIPSLIFRFKMTEEFMEELNSFSKIHQYDDRHDFKAAWELWVEDNKCLINTEIERLTALGYRGNILDKMYKSARYYFRKKSDAPTVPQSRRQYIHISRKLLDAMDNHIRVNIHNPEFKPKEDYITFCQENKAVLIEALNEMISEGITDSTLIQNKIKKTYKNRYFLVIAK